MRKFNDYLFVIPARGGSKGIINKNITIVNGKPLIAWSIEQALSVSPQCNVIVSTDSNEIAKVATEYGASVPFIRPETLAKDTTPTEPVLLHALEWFESQSTLTIKGIILLQPTSPLRHADTIKNAIAKFEKENADSLLSVTENHHFFWRNSSKPQALYDYNNRPRRQDIRNADRTYRENGSIYITTPETLKKNKNRLGGKITIFQMSEEESYEIDTITDLHIVTTLMREFRRDNKA
jgi:N-acylneuraminate cytidylyltransferase